MRNRLTALTGHQRTWTVVVLCLVPRLAYLWLAGPSGPDSHYWELAGGLLSDHALIYRGAETAAFTPGYPLFLALARGMTHESVLGVTLLQLAVACAGAALLDRLTRVVFGHDEAGWAAVALYAGHPYLIRQSIAFIEITVLSTLLLAAWCGWAERRHVMSIVWLTVATLTRAMVLPVVAGALLWLVWRRRLREA